MYLLGSRSKRARTFIDSPQSPFAVQQGANLVVRAVLRPLGYTEYVHWPSLLGMIDTPSALGHGRITMRAFPGEDYSPLREAANS